MGRLVLPTPTLITGNNNVAMANKDDATTDNKDPDAENASVTLPDEFLGIPLCLKPGKVVENVMDYPKHARS